jgi:hypothetical protein
MSNYPDGYTEPDFDDEPQPMDEAVTNPGDVQKIGGW